jgi:Protein of unknown function (DUF2459)
MPVTRHIYYLGFILSLVICSCSVRFPVETPAPTPQQAPSAVAPTEKVTIWLLADSLHTALALPYDWLIENGYRPPEGLRFTKGTQRLVVMSWGDRAAYVNQRWLTPWEVVHALFLPSPSVTEIIPVSWNIEGVCDQQRIYQAEVSRSHGAAVAAFLNGTARHDERGFPKVIGAASWGEGYLLDCPYSYYLPRVCNIWTAQCLEACGLDFVMLRSTSADRVISQCESQGFKKIHDGVKGYRR